MYNHGLVVSEERHPLDRFDVLGKAGQGEHQRHADYACRCLDQCGNAAHLL
jgi:hypothetical protein